MRAIICAGFFSSSGRFHSFQIFVTNFDVFDFFLNEEEACSYDLTSTC